MDDSKDKFQRGDVLYPKREGTVEPVPSKVVLKRAGLNYELCNYNDPILRGRDLNAKYLAKSTLPVTKVEAEFGLYKKDTFREKVKE